MEGCERRGQKLDLGAISTPRPGFRLVGEEHFESARWIMRRLLCDSVYATCSPQ